MSLPPVGSLANVPLREDAVETFATFCVQGDQEEEEEATQATRPCSARPTSASSMRAETMSFSPHLRFDLSEIDDGPRKPRRIATAPDMRTSFAIRANNFGRSSEGAASLMSLGRSRKQSDRSIVTWSSSTPRSSRASSKARASMDQWEDQLQAAVLELRDSEDPHLQCCMTSNTQVAKWDKLTLRRWFSRMDTDNNGSISKQEWFSFLRKNPKFREMLLNQNSGTADSVADRSDVATLKRLREEAKEMKKIMRVIRDLDMDKNGTLEFGEFVEFFRRTGRLVEYQDEENPREQMASILGGISTARPTSRDTADQLAHLAKHNLTADRRISIEQNVLQKISDHAATTEERP